MVRDAFVQRAALATAVSHALLQRVSEGLEPETLRIHRPRSVVSFGPLDLLAPGLPDAVAAARIRGFEPVKRLAGGRAAVFHEETIAFAWSIPDPSPRTGITRRFEEVAGIMVEAFDSLGIDARIGEIPGEYCPGRYSVNARGRTKLMGVGQRLVASAAHVGGVVVVDRSDRVRDVLVPVYGSLGLAWDPATAGSLADERPEITWSRAEAAILDAFGRRFDLDEVHLPDETLQRARELEPLHAMDGVQPGAR